MSIRETAKAALRGLGFYPLRTFLSVLGIVIGVASVIGLVAIGAGVQESVTSQISQLGSDVLTVSPAMQRGVWGRSATQTTVDASMAEDLVEHNPLIKQAVATLQTQGTMTVDNSTVDVTVVGVTPDYADIFAYPVQTGRFLRTSDQDLGADVIVLGAEVASTLFSGQDPLGRKVQLSAGNYPTRSFVVVGVMGSLGRTFAGNFDGQVYMPASTFFRWTGQRRVSSFILRAVSTDAAVDATDQVNFYLTRRVGEDKFRVQSQQTILETITSVVGTLTLSLGAIAGIALLVGGIGVMNVMLVSVKERTREIGIRKALGAKNRNILNQFLLEAVFLSLTGGLLGLFGGWGVAALVARWGNWPTVLPVQAIFLAVGFSTAVGLFFGIYPAMQAARLDPIESLSYE
ncbi:MAG: ABC transporter permease [Bacteroidota bacterium]